MAVDKVVEFHVIDCFHCHALFCMTNQSIVRLKRNHKMFWCPYCEGGQSWLGKSEAESLKEQIHEERETCDVKTHKLYDQLTDSREKLKALRKQNHDMTKICNPFDMAKRAKEARKRGFMVRARGGVVEVRCKTKDGIGTGEWEVLHLGHHRHGVVKD